MNSVQTMKIHMVQNVHRLFFPDRLGMTGFGYEYTACGGQVFARPHERFHTSNPAHVTCLHCLRMIDEGMVNLTPKTAREIADDLLGLQTYAALRNERALAREYVAYA